MHFRSITSLMAVAVALLANASMAVAQPESPQLQPGQLDRSFAGKGFALFEFGFEPGRGRGSEVTVLPDGRFLVLVDTYRADSVMRFNPDGSIDRSFGVRGVSMIGFRAAAMAVTSRGEIVVVGGADLTPSERYANFAVARLTPDGKPDRIFGSNGTAFFPGRHPGVATSVVALPGGEVLVLGHVYDLALRAIEMIKLDRTGQPVRSYGEGGTSIISVPAPFVSFSGSMSLQGDQTIVMLDHPGGGEGGLLRLNPDGTQDRSFGFNGVVSSSDLQKASGIADEEVASTSLTDDLEIAADGSMLIANAHAKLTRLLPDGTPDPSFGSGGQVRLQPEGLIWTQPSAVGLDGEGRVLFAGSVGHDPNSDVELLLGRLGPDGKLDPNFGRGGIVTTPVPGSRHSAAHDLASLPDGRVLLVGEAGPRFAGGDSIVLARYLGDGELDRTFGTSGLALVRPSVPSSDEATELLVDRRGRTIVAGTAGGLPTLMALRPGGRLERAFGDRGRASAALGLDPISPERGGAFARYPGGKLLLGAGSRAGGAILRYRSDGKLDRSFGRDGAAPTACLDQVLSLEVLRNGRILAAGLEYGENRIALTRLSASGMLDRGFGTRAGCTFGAELDDDQPAQAPVEIELLSGGRILLVGNARQQPFVAEYSPSGRRDRRFDGTGMPLRNARAVAIDPDGRILLAGQIAQHGALLRLLPNGTVDHRFGRDGIIPVNLGPGTSLDALRVEPGGGIVFAGGFKRPCRTLRRCAAAVFVARLRPTGAFDPSFGHHGIWQRRFGTGARLTSLALGPGTITIGGRARKRPGDDQLLVARLRR